MIPNLFWVELRKKAPEPAWSWVISALHQDPVVWSALESTDLGWKALAKGSGQPEAWSPGRLALIALEEAVSPEGLRALPMQPLAPALKARVAQAYEAWVSQPGSEPLSLPRAGLLALALREWRRLKGGWDELPGEIAGRGDGLKTVLACLYAFAPDPLALLAALFKAAPAGLLAEAGLHAFLSNPCPAPQQVETLGPLLSAAGPQIFMETLRTLAEQAPALGAQLAGTVCPVEPALEKTAGQPPTENLGRPACVSRPDAVTACLEQVSAQAINAQALQAAHRPAGSAAVLAQAIQAAVRLQAHLSARLAQAVEQGVEDDPIETAARAVNAWKQAAAGLPGDLQITAGLAQALLRSGSLEEARAVLQPAAGSEAPDHPCWLVAAALVARQDLDPARAVQLARQALALAQARPSALPPGFYLDLARLSFDLDLAQETLETAHLGLATVPNQPDLLELVVLTHLAGDDPAAALSAAYPAYAAAYASTTATASTAAASETGSAPPASKQQIQAHRLLVTCLEAAGEWESAFQERIRLMESLAAPASADWRDLARCALQAGQPQQAYQACQQALQLDCGDGFVFGLLGEIELSYGNCQAAIEKFREATRAAPDQADLWIHLAGAYRQAGQPAKALEALRTGSQAAPDSPDIFLALGEACLLEKAPTQALAFLRRAATLAAQVQTEVPPRRVQEKKKVLAVENRIRFFLGSALNELGHRVEAEAVLHQAYQAGSRGIHTDPEIAYAYAKTLVGNHKAGLALPIFESVVQSEPDDPQPFLDYAQALLDPAGRTPARCRRAIPLLRRVIQLEKIAAPLPGEDPGLASEALALLAESYAAIEDFPHAETAFRQALETPLAQDPAWRARLSLGLGHTALALGQYETSLAALQEAEQSQPENPEIQRRLTEAFIRLGLAGNAFAAAQRILHLNPADPETLAWFGEQCILIHRLTPGLQPAVLEEAVQALENASQLVPSRVDLLLRLSQLRIERGETTLAAGTLAKLIQNPSPVSRLHLLQAGQTLVSLGEPALAVPVLERALGLSGGPVATDLRFSEGDQVEILSTLAGAYHQVGEDGPALEAYDRAIQLHPDGTHLYQRKASILSGRKDFAASLACLQKARELAPEDPDLLYQIAQVYQALGNLPAAYAWARKVLHLPEQSAAVPTREACQALAVGIAYSLLRPELAFSLLNSGPVGRGQASPELEYLHVELAQDFLQCQAASSFLEQVCQAPQSLACLVFQGRLALRSGQAPLESRLKQSLAAYQAGCEQARLAASGEGAGLSRPVLRSLAKAALELGRWEEGFGFLEQLIQSDPHDPSAHFALARALVLQAEFERTCLPLQALAHKPEDARREERYQRFCTALATAFRGIHQALECQQDLSFPPEESGIEELGLRAAEAGLNRWQLRGELVFHPALEIRRAFQERVSAPEELAACLLADLELNAGETGLPLDDPAQTQHPLVWLRLGLARENTSLPVALEAVRRGEELLIQPEFSFLLETPLLHALRARLEIQSGRDEQARVEAIQAIEAALQIWPEEARWRALAASIYLAPGEAVSQANLDRAIYHLERSIASEPGFALHYQSLGAALEKKGSPEQAIRVYEQLTRLAPDQTPGWLALARAQMSAREFLQASASAEKGLEQAPGDPDALLLCGELSLITNQPRQALVRAQAILHATPDHPAALRLMAQALEKLGRPTEALAAYEKAIHLVQDPLPLELERARLLRRSEGLDFALQALQKLAKHYPNEPGFLAPLAEGLMEAGQGEAALQAARQALAAADGKLSCEEEANLRYLIGRQMREAGQLDQAVHQLTEAIRIAPGHLEAYLELGRVHQDRRQFALALKIYRQAISIGENDARPYYQAGLALKESKDYLGAETMLRRAAELAPQEVAIHRMLGAVVALNLVHNRR